MRPTVVAVLALLFATLFSSDPNEGGMFMPSAAYAKESGGGDGGGDGGEGGGGGHGDGGGGDGGGHGGGDGGGGDGGGGDGGGDGSSGDGSGGGGDGSSGDGSGGGGDGSSGDGSSGGGHGDGDGGDSNSGPDNSGKSRDGRPSRNDRESHTRNVEDIERRHANGWIERIQSGRYEVRDARNRTVINRAATPEDIDRLHPPNER